MGIAPGLDLTEIRPIFDPCTYYAASAHEGAPYHEVDWRGSKALIVGSEAHGLGRDARDLCDGQVSIPMDERVESLNAAVACGVILAEAFRQRRGRFQSTVLGVH